MERQLQQLVRLTDDLLDVSRITRNKIELRRERIDLRAVLHSAIETIAAADRRAGAQLTVELPTAPLWVDADFTRLAQAFSNLLNNAVEVHRAAAAGSRVAAIGDGEAAIVTRDRYRASASIRERCCRASSTCSSQLEHGANRTRERPRHRPDAGQAAGRAARRHASRRTATGPGAAATFIVRLPLAAPPRRAGSRSAPTHSPRRRAAACSSPKTSRTPPR